VTIDVLRSIEERFWARVDVGSAARCWVWKRGVAGSGYGSFIIPGAASPTGKALHIGAHRVAWMLGNGQQPPKHAVIDHLCGNRLCCNPAHLEAVAQVINATRAGVVGMGFKAAKPKPYTAKDGTVTWRVRFRRYGERGRIVEGSQTFRSEAEAERFIADRPWTPYVEEPV